MGGRPAMKMTTVTIVILCGLAGVSAAASAQPGSDHATAYGLEDQSRFVYGCFGPCECADLEESLKGTFLLEFTGCDGLYDHYRVSDVAWEVSRVDGNVPITG